MTEKVNENQKKEQNSDKNKLLIQAAGKSILLFTIVALGFFLPAGTLLYWEAWLFIGLFVIMMIFILRFMIKNDPDLLRRRLERGEKRREQKLILTISNLLLLGLFLFPGFDHRWNWSSVPILLVIVSDIIFSLGYLMFFYIIKENSYASRTVKVEKDIQQVITTGPYSIIRHPMYTSIFIMFGIMPLALGSYWGLLFLPLLIIMLILRVNDEEKMLTEELEGYKEYKQKTKYKIIPYIW